MRRRSEDETGRGYRSPAPRLTAEEAPWDYVQEPLIGFEQVDGETFPYWRAPHVEVFPDDGRQPPDDR